jgi:hypothetical protein
VDHGRRHLVADGHPVCRIEIDCVVKRLQQQSRQHRIWVRLRKRSRSGPEFHLHLRALGVQIVDRARLSHPNGTSTKLLETKDVSVQVVRIGPRGMLYTVTRPNGKAENWLLKFCLQGTPRPLTSFS